MAELRLIDANALLKEFEKRQEQQTNEYCDCFLNDAQEISTEWWCIEDMVMSAPTIDAVPVVHGRWRINKQFADYECSACGQGDIISPYFKRLKLNYCPNCGAKMEGDAINDC